MKDLATLRSRLEKERDPGERLRLIEETLRPPEPQLLDTSVLQNLDWVDRKLEEFEEAEDAEISALGGTHGLDDGGVWDEQKIILLEQRFGKELARDLLDLGTLYKEFEYQGGYPWLVCDAAIKEAGALQTHKGGRLRELVSFISGHQEDWSIDSYPEIAQGLLLARGQLRISPLILRALGVSCRADISAETGPLSFLRDAGDREIVTHALIANIPAILTTDRRTFWAHRVRLEEMGVQVIRPSELLDQYVPFWEMCEEEFARRRASIPRSIPGRITD